MEKELEKRARMEKIDNDLNNPISALEKFKVDKSKEN